MKQFSPAIFGLILICFFLPFMNLSCENRELISLTGVQVATGTTIQTPSFLGQQLPQKIPAEPLASLALVSACVGLGTSFLRSNKNTIIPAAVGGIGAVLLLVIKAKVDDAILKQGQGIIKVNYGLGFWLSFLLFGTAAILNGWIFYQNKKQIKD